MSAGWQVGDLALCVDARKAPLDDGRTYVVTEAFYDVGRNSLGEITNFTLLVDGATPEYWSSGFCASRFRKIAPDQHEPCEAEFVTLLKRSRKQVAA